MTTCIAYDDGGDICGQPAVAIDARRGGMVCERHRPNFRKRQTEPVVPREATWPRLLAEMQAQGFHHFHHVMRPSEIIAIDAELQGLPAIGRAIGSLPVLPWNCCWDQELEKFYVFVDQRQSEGRQEFVFLRPQDL